ncbi:hypothetical protein AQ721_14885 [Burkholderia pseudomallei]|nr:hypothetical protein BOC43_36825 [Burkholderia pseudomallei]OMR22290.1 hypothetical protein AQ721_14885 [Burkholderia pseudomallei]
MIMTDDEAKARIDALHDEAATILAEQGLSPLQVYCLILEQVTVRHEPTLRLLADAAAHDQWFREQVREGLEEADDPNTKWVSNDEAQERYASKRAKLLDRIGKGNA